MESNPDPNSFGSIDEVFKNASKSIEDAEMFMSKAKPGIEKAKTSKDGRKKIVSKASEVVNALLEPASKVADLLKFVGNFYPPCTVAGSVLQGIVDVETGRRENDVRIAVIYVEFSTSLVQLGSLKPGFQHVRTLQGPLNILLSKVGKLMEEFGQFCESFYEGKSIKNKFKHLLNFKPNSEALEDFHQRLASFKSDLTLLLTQQAVLIMSSNTTSLKSIEGKIDQMFAFYAGLKDETEMTAEEFIARNGGEDNVLMNDALIEELARKLEVQLTSSILRAVKEGADESFRRSYESFQLKLHFALSNRVEISTETIIKEIQNGPYEVIKDPDMKAIWKETAPKESNLKRRQYIDAMVYYFHTQWKKYKVDHKTNRADFWVNSIISKVHYQPAIGDAIDDDASGYISVEEVNEFMQRKPSSWSTPLWIAYWAYGWDADSLYYQERINKAYKQLDSLVEKAGSKKDKIKEYIDGTRADIQKLVNSLFSIDDLDAAADTQMKKLQDEWRTLTESSIKKQLTTVNFKIEYDSMAAVCQSDRIEVTLLPLVSILLSRHIYLMSQKTVKDEDIEEATNTMSNILDVVRDRISDLRRIWRRQRQDVDVQIRYYVNGLFQDFYKEHYKDFQTDDETEYSDWDSDDEWGPEDDKDGKGDQQAPVSQTRSGVQNQAPASRSLGGAEQATRAPQQSQSKTAVSPIDDDNDYGSQRVYRNDYEGQGQGDGNRQEQENEGEGEDSGEPEEPQENEGEQENEEEGERDAVEEGGSEIREEDNNENYDAGPDEEGGDDDGDGGDDDDY